MKICHADVSVEIKDTAVWIREGVRINRIDMRTHTIHTNEGVQVIRSHDPKGITIVSLDTQVSEKDLVARVVNLRHQQRHQKR